MTSDQAPSAAGAFSGRTDFPVAPLFVPAHVPKLTTKALSLRPDAIVLDLEDAVPAEQKDAARNAVPAIVAQMPGTAFVRINALRKVGYSYSVVCGEADLGVVVVPGLRGVVQPKVETADDVRELDGLLSELERRKGVAPGTLQMIAVIETAKGVLQLTDIVTAGPQRSWCLCFGAGDYTADIGVAWSALETESQTARSLVVMASAAGRLPRPIDSAFPAIADTEGFRRSAVNAKTLGFQGKFAIHPEQIGIVVDVFAPTAQEIDWAGRVLAALAVAESKGQGAFTVDGRMVDYPIVERARRLLGRN